MPRTVLVPTPDPPSSGGPERPPSGRRQPSQRLARTRVAPALDCLHLPVSRAPEVRPFRKPLPRQPVHVLVRPALPEVMLAGEEEPRAERHRHAGMARELLAAMPIST